MASEFGNCLGTWNGPIPWNGPTPGNGSTFGNGPAPVNGPGTSHSVSEAVSLIQKSEWTGVPGRIQSHGDSSRFHVNSRQFDVNPVVKALGDHKSGRVW